MLPLVLAFCLCLGCASAALGTTYYVDSVGGSDNNTGTSQSAPWQSLNKVNSVTFQPGDQILLKAGSVWNGQHLWPKGSGTAADPIVVDMYGTGDMPVINCNFVHNGAVYLYNQEYWEINNLELTNWTTGDPDDQNGVRIIGEDAGVLNHIHLKGLDIHDVNGSLYSRQIRDKAKTTGGILVDCYGSTPTRFNDILIEGCNIHYVDRTGIKFWSDFSNWKCATPFRHSNVVIRNNVLDDIGGDGINPCICDGPLVEYNVAGHCCARSTNVNVPMWGWDVTDAMFQYNEAYACHPSGDSQAWDIDDMNHRTIFQYNYSHDNAGGFMLVCSARGTCNIVEDCHVRYNISQNDLFRTIRFSGVDMWGVRLYNNVWYIGADTVDWIFEHNGGSAPDTQYLNNIIYLLDTDCAYDLEGAAKTGVVFDYNVFYGYHPPGEPGNPGEPNDPHKIIDDPPGSCQPQLLVDPGSGGTGRDSVDGYKLCAGSPAIDSGMEVPSNGGQDYWGNTVPANGITDRGAHEYQSGPPPPPVADFSGTPTSGDAPLNVMFTDLSTNNPTSWDWTFGDGGTDTVQNPSHTYDVGTYTVSLTAENAGGSDTETKNNYITANEPQPNPPVADFSGSPTSGPAPLDVDFTDLSTNDPTAWDWTFGDGGTDTVQNPSHTYAEDTYTVSLTATNEYGQDTETKTDYITATSGGENDYFCTSATITDGTLKSGDHTDTHASDDAYMVVTSVKVGGKQCTIIEYTFETGLSSASSMSVTSESKVSYAAPPDGQRERVYVYNYSTSGYDLLGDDWVLETDTTNVTGVPSPSDYLSAGGQVKVEVRTGDRDNDVFDHSIDLVKITAAP